MRESTALDALRRPRYFQNSVNDSFARYNKDSLNLKLQIRHVYFYPVEVALSTCVVD